MLRKLATLIDTVPAQLRIGRVRRGPAARSRVGLRFIDLGNCVLRLRQAGTRGPSLVIAADPPVPLELYDELLTRLGSRYRLSVFELPGFGCSLPRAGFQFSMATTQATVSALLERLPGGPHVLLFPCVAGFLAIAIAASSPQLVAGLILSQTPDWSGAQHWLNGRDPRGLLRRPLLGQLALALLKRRRIRQWYRSALATPALVEPFSIATLENFDHGGCFCLASGFQDFMRDHAGLLRPVAHRSLLLQGLADPSHRSTDWSATRALVPDSRSLALPGVGHFPELEAAAECASAIDGFVTELKAHPSWST